MSAVTSSAPRSATGLKALLARHPLLSMYALLFLLAWPFLILDALSSNGVIPRLPPILGFLTGWAPAAAALTVTAITAGRQGVRRLLGRFLVWRVRPAWYVGAFFFMAVMILGGIGLHVIMGGSLPRIPAAGAPLVNVVLSFFAMLVFGVLLNTEEIAWRGFALPRLQARYGALLACLLLAIPEALLHLPYFWNHGIAFYQNVGLFWFSAFSVAAVFIYTFIFNKTRGSLLIVTLLHASQNAWANLLSDNTTRPFIFTVALMWMIALALILATKGQLGYNPAPDSQK